MKKFTIILLTVFISFSANAQLQEAKKYFDEKKLPVDQSEIEPIKNIEPLSGNLKLPFGETDEKVYPQFRFKVHDYFEAFVFTLVDAQGISKLMMNIYDEYENLISETELDYAPFGDIGFLIDAKYHAQKVVLEQNRIGFWVSEDNKCASYMTVHDPVETYTDLFTINRDGDIKYFSKYLAQSTVEIFLNALSEQNFTGAFYTQKIASWGNFDHFASKKAFGGITNIAIDSLSYISGDDKKAHVFCNATYYDKINGDADIEQIFTLSYTEGNWYITGMKIKSFKKRRDYIDETDSFKDLTLKLSNITNTGFDFEIEAVSSKLCPDEYQNPYVNVSGKAKYTDTNHAIYKDGIFSMSFIFSGNQLTLSAKNYQVKYKNLNLVLNKTYKIRK